MCGLWVPHLGAGEPSGPGTKFLSSWLGWDRRRGVELHRGRNTFSRDAKIDLEPEPAVENSIVFSGMD